MIGKIPLHHRIMERLGDGKCVQRSAAGPCSDSHPFRYCEICLDQATSSTCGGSLILIALGATDEFLSPSEIPTADGCIWHETCNSEGGGHHGQAPAQSCSFLQYLPNADIIRPLSPSHWREPSTGELGDQLPRAGGARDTPLPPPPGDGRLGLADNSSGAGSTTSF